MHNWIPTISATRSQSLRKGLGSASAAQKCLHFCIVEPIGEGLRRSPLKGECFDKVFMGVICLSRKGNSGSEAGMTNGARG